MFTQLSLIVLLWGTMCGGLALISDVGVILIDRLAAAQQGGGSWDVPDWVNGRTCMAAVALFVLFPLCLQRHMREVRLCVCLLSCSWPGADGYLPGCTCVLLCPAYLVFTGGTVLLGTVRSVDTCAACSLPCPSCICHLHSWRPLQQQA